MAAFRGDMNADGRRWGGDRHRGRVKLPTNAHPVVHTLFTEMNGQMTTMAEVAERSGVNAHTIRGWRGRWVPTVANLDACLNVLGLRLAVVPINGPMPRPTRTTGAA